MPGPAPGDRRLPARHANVRGAVAAGSKSRKKTRVENTVLVPSGGGGHLRHRASGGHAALRPAAWAGGGGYPDCVARRRDRKQRPAAPGTLASSGSDRLGGGLFVPSGNRRPDRAHGAAGRTVPGAERNQGPSSGRGAVLRPGVSAGGRTAARIRAADPVVVRRGRPLSPARLTLLRL